jgi:hypothetical protein
VQTAGGVEGVGWMYSNISAGISVVGDAWLGAIYNTASGYPLSVVRFDTFAVNITQQLCVTRSVVLLHYSTVRGLGSAKSLFPFLHRLQTRKSLYKHGVVEVYLLLLYFHATSEISR